MPYIPTISLASSTAGPAGDGGVTGGGAATSADSANEARRGNATLSLEQSLATVPSSAKLVGAIAAANAVAVATAAVYPEVPIAMRAALAFYFSNSRSSGKADDGEEEGVAEAGMANVQDEVNSVFQRHAEMHTRTLVQQSKEITTKTATATEAPPPPPKGGAASDWEGYAWLLHHAIESVPPEPEQVVYTGWVGGVEPDAEDSASTAGYSHGMYCWSSVQQCRISVATMRSALAVGGGGGGGGGNGYGKPEAPPQAASTAPSNNSNKARTLVRVNLFEPVARNLQAFAGMTTESIRPDCVVLPPFFSFEVERISSVDSGKLSIIQCLQKCAAPGAQAAGLNLGAFAQDFSPKWWNKPGRKVGKAGKAGKAASKSRNANAAAAAAAATAGSSAPTTVTESAGGSSAETSPPVRRAGGNGSLRQIRAVAVKKATARAKQHTNGSSTASSSSSSLFAPGAGGAGRGRAGGQGAAPSAGRAGAATPSTLAGAGAATARAQRVFGDEGEEGPRGFHPALHGNRASLSEHEGRPNARALRSNAMGSYDDAVVYTDSPLMLNDEYVLQFHVLVDVPHTTWSGSLELGLAPNLPASRSDIPESLAGSDDIVTPDCDQLFDAEGLESGDVVTFRLDEDGVISILVNGEDVDDGPCGCEEPNPDNNQTDLTVEDTYYGVVSIYGQTRSVTLLTNEEYEARGF